MPTDPRRELSNSWRTDGEISPSGQRIPEPPPQPKVEINVAPQNRDREDIGTASARGFFMGFSITAGIVTALVVVLVVLPILLMLGLAFTRWILSPPDPIIIPVKVPAEPEPEPEPPPLSEQAIDFAEKQVRGRLEPGEGKMMGRGVIIESDAYGTFLIVGKTDAFAEWKVRLGSVDGRFQIGTIYIDGEDRTEVR